MCACGNVWIKSKSSYIDVTEGLWKTCRNDDCDTLSNDLLPDWFKAVRAFAAISVLVCITAIILSILVAMEKTRGFVASIFLFLAAGSMAVALIVYASESKLSSTLEYGWSFYLGWVGVVGGVTPAIIGFFAERA